MSINVKNVLQSSKGAIFRDHEQVSKGAFLEIIRKEIKAIIFKRIFEPH